MSDYTLFLQAYVTSFSDNVSEPIWSKDYQAFDRGIRYNVKFKKIENITLDNTDSRTINFSNKANSDWVVIIARVVGAARLVTAGLDTDGITPIAGNLPTYGTSLLPGIAMISTYNLTGLSVLSLADGTVVELFAAISEEDS